MSDTTIDEILNGLLDQANVEIVYDDPKDKSTVTILFGSKAQAKSALYDLILKEVVGEDVPFSLAREMEMGEFDMSARKLESQNSLRASQRNKLKQLFNEKE